MPPGSEGAAAAAPAGGAARSRCGGDSPRAPGTPPRRSGPRRAVTFVLSRNEPLRDRGAVHRLSLCERPLRRDLDPDGLFEVDLGAKHRRIGRGDRIVTALLLLSPRTRIASSPPLVGGAI